MKNKSEIIEVIDCDTKESVKFHCKFLLSFNGRTVKEMKEIVKKAGINEEGYKK